MIKYLLNPLTVLIICFLIWVATITYSFQCGVKYALKHLIPEGVGVLQAQVESLDPNTDPKYKEIQKKYIFRDGKWYPRDLPCVKK